MLEGPQGTLYGAGAQAGAVRYITNKPKIERPKAPSTRATRPPPMAIPARACEAHINVPLIAGHPGAAGVIYDDTRGGYIHNIPGTFARSAPTSASSYYFDGVVPPGSATVSNNDPGRIAPTIPTTYQGTRAFGTVQVQRRLESAAAAELPDARGGRELRLCPCARRFECPAVQPVQRQGSVREHGLDVERPDRSAEGRLHRRLSRSQRQRDAGLHRLCARCVRRLLSVQWSVAPPRHRHPERLLLAERLLAGHREQHPSDPRAAAQHAG